MIDITISPELKSKIDNIFIGSIQAEVVVKPSDNLLLKKIDLACDDFAQNHKVEDISKQEVIAASRKAYKILGKDPARYRLSSEALMRRIVKEKGIYKINNIVEINNLISIKSRFPICAFDVSKIKGNVQFTIGTKNDKYYGIGRGLLNIENLPVFEDQIGKFGSPTSDSERVKITNETTQLSMNIVSFNGLENLEFYIKELEQNLLEFADAKQIETRIII